MLQYLDLASATQLLKAKGFNPRDIECVLDLTGPQHSNGVSLWRADRIERLASRAYWLGAHEPVVSIPAAA
ncbi:hypothetical protein [Parvibaculum sp.]|uniref:hypothetical protein n=1 Tax=Parvibaculum sp. TaxID=2024848 RepID=UPI00320D53BA